MSTVPLSSLAEAAVIEDRNPLERWRGFVQQALGRCRGKSAYALADQVVYSFGNMVVAALLSRHAGAREFGIYILTQRAMDVLIQLCNVFLWAPFTFRFPGTTEERRPLYMGSLVQGQLLLCILFTAVLWGAARCFSGPHHIELHASFGALVLAGGGILFREFTRRLYFALLRMEEAFWTDIATVLLQIAGVGWLSARRQLNVANTLVVLFVGASAVSFWWLLRDWRAWKISGSDLLSDAKEDFKLGRWFFGSNMVFLAGAQCNPWVLNAMFGGSAVGSYAICESLVNIPRVAFTSMQNVMGPMIARARIVGGKASVRTEVRRLDNLLLAASALFALAILVFGPYLAKVIYREVPAGTRTISGVLALNLIAYSATLAQAYGLSALDKANKTFYANLLGILVQAATCYVLIRRFHVPGAAAAMLVGSIVVLIARQRFYSRELATA